MASRHYLEIMELEWDWLEEVVAALSWENPLWLDSRLVIEPLQTDSEGTRHEEPEPPSFPCCLLTSRQSCSLHPPFSNLPHWQHLQSRTAGQGPPG